MSFAQPFSESRSIQSALQRHKTDGHDGGASSPVETPGGSTPGTSTAPPVSVMESRRTNFKRRTTDLKRSWY